MADPSMASIPPGFQVMVQRMNTRVAKLEQQVDDLKRRLAGVETELHRRKGGRPRKDAA